MKIPWVWRAAFLGGAGLAIYLLAASMVKQPVIGQSLQVGIETKPHSVLAATFPRDSQTASECKRLLAGLSELCKGIEASKLSLLTLRKGNLQPDSAMWELRKLAHLHPEVLPLIREFVKSTEAPIAARMMAIFSLAHPQSPDAIRLLAGIIADTKNIQLANAACFAGDASASNGIGHAFEFLLRHLAFLGAPQCYATEITHEITYHPDDALRYPRLSRCTSEGLDFSPLVDAMLALVSTGGKDVEANVIISILKRDLNRSEMSENQRLAFSELVRKTYLSSDSGWQASLDVLVSNSRAAGRSEISTLAQGINRLDIKRKVRVLGAVATFSQSAIFEDQFGGSWREVLEHLGRRETESGVRMQEAGSLCWALAMCQQLDTATLTSQATDTMKARIANAIYARATRGKLVKSEASRVCDLASVLLNESNLAVKYSAARSLAGLVRHSGEALGGQVVNQIREVLSRWINDERRMQRDPELLAILSTIESRIK